ncbi:hypothetical protein, partial [uncultured Nitrospira sp.]|uniref:hypothetical protein n=1 Tax=uncultured Nitrospira sp. TaxID=157176 RepID=UPI00314042A6
MKVVKLLMGLTCLCIFWQTSAWAIEPLIEVLREKNLITKEEWIKIEAASEKKAEEEIKALEAKFPVRVGWGNKGLEFSTSDGKFATQIQWRFQGRWS